MAKTEQRQENADEAVEIGIVSSLGKYSDGEGARPRC